LTVAITNIIEFPVESRLASGSEGATMSTQMVGIKEAAEISGMSQAWWRQRILRKEVRFYKIGRRVLFDQADIVRILEKGRVEPQERRTNTSPDGRHTPMESGE
jgi:hypothetical protein